MEHVNATLKQSIKNTFSEMLIQKPCKSHVFKTRWWFLFSEICGVHVDSEDKKKKKKTRKTKNTTLFDSECHVTYFKSRKWIIRQAQAVWLISPIFNVKPNTYLPSFSYLQHPYHSSIKNHNTGYHSDFKLLTNKNLRFLDYQLKSQKNSGLKTNHTESQLFKASRHYFFL